jgi:hypothetical protein
MIWITYDHLLYILLTLFISRSIYDVMRILSGCDNQKAIAIRVKDKISKPKRIPTVLIVGAGAAGLSV